jgi:hypothetical protein
MPTTPRQRQQDFMETLANAITQWQHVEMELFQIFAALVKSEDGKNYVAISAAFHSVVNFNTRLEMTHAAARAVLTAEPFNIWLGLHKRMSERVKKRNALVHFMLMGDATEGALIWHLQPSIYDVTRSGAQPRLKYGIRHI